LVQDEKVITRMLADRIIQINVLGREATALLKKDLAASDYPASLTTGPDAQLAERVQKMLKELDLTAIAKRAGL
ncbi:MAG: hypothetical protein N2C14_01160, partial [Planctomycetales bacterium]